MAKRAEADSNVLDEIRLAMIDIQANKPIPRQVGVPLDDVHGQIFRRAYIALRNGGVKMSDGRVVKHEANVFQWLLEQLII